MNDIYTQFQKKSTGKFLFFIATFIAKDFGNL